MLSWVLLHQRIQKKCNWSQCCHIANEYGNKLKILNDCLVNVKDIFITWTYFCNILTFHFFQWIPAVDYITIAMQSDVLLNIGCSDNIYPQMERWILNTSMALGQWCIIMHDSLTSWFDLFQGSSTRVANCFINQYVITQSAPIYIHILLVHWTQM